MFSAITGPPFGGALWLIVAGGGKIYSVNPAGAVTEIGKGFSSNRWSIIQAPESKGVSSQGPIYLNNGIDKPQYWTGSGEVKEWKGIASSPKLTDGVANEKSVYFKSKTAGFIASDVGLQVKFETTVKSETRTITEAIIEAVISPEEVKLGIPEVGWDATVTAVHFTLERAFYGLEAHVPNGGYMIFAGNRVWIAGITADPSAVWFSELVSIGEGGAQADPSQFPSSNVVRFDGSDGKEITGLGTVGPYILVFKESKVWAIHNLNTGENRKISDGTGCVAHRSIVETDQGTYFLTTDSGIYITNGSSVRETSYNVTPTILAINPKERQNAAGAYFANHYYLSYASGANATPNRTLDYDTVLKSWWLHDFAPNQWTTWEPTTGATALYAVVPGLKKGVVKAFVEGVYEDSGVVYPGNGTLAAYWFSPWDPFAYYVFRHRIEAPFIKKRVRQVFFDGEGEIIPIVAKNFAVGGEEVGGVVGANPANKLELPINFSEGAQVFANEEEEQKFAGEKLKGVEMIFGGSATVQAARLYSLGVGNTWSVGYGNNTNQPFLVTSFAMMATFRKS